MAALACALIPVACGGGDAKSPGTCPAGTVLKGSDCLPSEAADDSSSSDTHGGAKATGTDSSASGGGGGAGDDSSAATTGTPYDRDAVEVQLKRAARQIKSACGSATDDEGKATGPWGATKVTITLGRNGHVKDVKVPAAYDGKPAGLCVVNAFQKAQYPPYGGSTDVTVDWDVELVAPKK